MSAVAVITIVQVDASNPDPEIQKRAKRGMPRRSSASPLTTGSAARKVAFP